MKIGIIGSGVVAQTLAGGVLKNGHDGMMGTRDAAKLADWAKANPTGKVGKFTDTARFGDLVVLAVKGSVVAEAVHGAGVTNLRGKTVIDAPNPIADAPPVNGVLKFTTTLDESM